LYDMSLNGLDSSGCAAVVAPPRGAVKWREPTQRLQVITTPKSTRLICVG
jgi:hypothetical protein